MTDRFYPPVHFVLEVVAYSLRLVDLIRARLPTTPQTQTPVDLNRIAGQDVYFEVWWAAFQAIHAIEEARRPELIQGPNGSFAVDRRGWPRLLIADLDHTRQALEAVLKHYGWMALIGANDAMLCGDGNKGSAGADALFPIDREGPPIPVQLLDDLEHRATNLRDGVTRTVSADTSSEISYAFESIGREVVTYLTPISEALASSAAVIGATFQRIVDSRPGLPLPKALKQMAGGSTVSAAHVMAYLTRFHHISIADYVKLTDKQIHGFLEADARLDTTPEESPAPPPEGESLYIFAKRKKYHLRFADEKGKAPVSKGLEMIEFLLKQPNKEATVFDIEASLSEDRPVHTISETEAVASIENDGRTLWNGFSRGGDDQVAPATREDIQRVEEELEILRRKSADADLQGDTRRAKELDNQIEVGEQWLKEQQRLQQGQIRHRPTTSRLESARQRLKNAYSGALKKLRDEEMPRLAEHLDQQIKYESHTYKYIPIPGIDWVFDEQAR
jgi:hypothetical protein